MPSGHPYGVQPELGDQSHIRTNGLGLFAKLGDEQLVSILHLLSPRDLTVLGTVSRAMHCFCNHDDIWKGIVLENVPDWEYNESWQETYLRHAIPEYKPSSKQPRHHIANGFQSDLLYQSWLCGIIEIDPSWLEVENVDRVSDISVEEFRSKYEIPNIPVILADTVSKWPAMKKWTRQHLLKALKDHQVLVGDAPMTFERYCQYADNQSDEQPLYLFDKHFADNVPSLAADYSVPPHFAADLFQVLGPDARPDYRWLIIGPYRSGSTFHKDPNQTCAWNAVCRGSKKWLLYPPLATPPGVQASEDGADVASPVSVMEWFLKFYNIKDCSNGVVPLECTVKAGEVLFVPRGWWHIALNLEDDTIAVTQNYVCPANLDNVLQFLETRNPALISGVETDEERITLYDRFVAALKSKMPDVWYQLEKDRELKKQQLEASLKLSSLFKTTDNAAVIDSSSQQEGQQEKDAQPFSFKFSF